MLLLTWSHAVHWAVPSRLTALMRETVNDVLACAAAFLPGTLYEQWYSFQQKDMLVLPPYPLTFCHKFSDHRLHASGYRIAFVFLFRISMCSRGTGTEAMQMEPAESLLRLKMTAQVLQCFKNAYLQARSTRICFTKNMFLVHFL